MTIHTYTTPRKKTEVHHGERGAHGSTYLGSVDHTGPKHFQSWISSGQAVNPTGIPKGHNPHGISHKDLSGAINHVADAHGIGHENWEHHVEQSKLKEAVEMVLEGQPVDAGTILFEHVQDLMRDRMHEMVKGIQARKYSTLVEGVTKYRHGQHLVADVHANGEHVGYITHEKDPHEHFKLHSTSPHSTYAHSTHEHYHEAEREAKKLVQTHIHGETDNPTEHEPAMAAESFNTPGQEANEALEPGISKVTRMGPTSAITSAPSKPNTPKGYHSTNPETGVHSIHHTASKKIIGSIETMSHKDSQKHGGANVRAHHFHDEEGAVSHHATQERAVSHLVAKHKAMGGGVDDLHEDVTAFPAHRVLPAAKHNPGHSASVLPIDAHAKHIHVHTQDHQYHEVHHGHPRAHDSEFLGTIHKRDTGGKYPYVSHSYGMEGRNVGHGTHETLHAAAQHIANHHGLDGAKKVHVNETLTEAEHKQKSSNVRHQGRTKITKVRVRNGKIQRQKKSSDVKGFRTEGGKVVRMTSQEKQHRRLGARKAARKRRSHRGQIHRHLLQSLRKRKTLGVH